MRVSVLFVMSRTAELLLMHAHCLFPILGEVPTSDNNVLRLRYCLASGYFPALNAGATFGTDRERLAQGKHPRAVPSVQVGP